MPRDTSFEAQVSAWMREEMKKRGLSYRDVARFCQIDPRTAARRLNAGLPGHPKSPAWYLGFGLDLCALFGVSFEDLNLLGGIISEHNSSLIDTCEKTARQLRYRSRLIVCQNCHQLGLLLIGPHHALVHSVKGAGHAVMSARSQGWLTFKGGVSLARKFWKSGLPLHDPDKKQTIPSLHRSIFNQLSPEEHLFFPPPHFFELCRSESLLDDFESRGPPEPSQN